MHFRLIELVSAAGDPARASEDRVALGSGMAWVIDGATDLGEPGLMGTVTGGAWFADRLSIECGTAAVDQSLHDRIVAAHGKVCEAYEAERRRGALGAWEVPSGAFMAAAIEGESIRFVWAADCTALMCSAGEARRVGQDASDEVALATTFTNPGERLTELRRQRSLPERAALTATLGSARHVRECAMPLRAGDVVLMSDGLAALLDVFAMAPQEFHELLRSDGLAGALSLLRRLERSEGAPTRLKRSDDASAIWLAVD